LGLFGKKAIMKFFLIFISLFIAHLASYSQVLPMEQLADTARIFGNDIISTGDFEFNASFTPDGKTVFFSKATINFAYIAIFYSRLQGTKWSAPAAVSFTGVYRDTDPFVSADGKRLYFSSDRPVNGKPYADYDYKYFYVNLDGNKVVSQPVLLNLPLASGMNPLYPSFADNGNIYFFSIDAGKDADIYMCAYDHGSYLPPVKLPFNDPKFFDFDPVIAHDESFIIFASNSRKGVGGMDLWVSFKNSGTWGEPVNMGDKVNTKGNDGAPGLSRDDRTLYFSSFREKINRPLYKNGKPTTKEIFDLMHSAKNGLRNIYEINIADLKRP